MKELTEHEFKQLDSELYYVIVHNDSYYRDRFIRTLAMLFGGNSQDAKLEEPTTQQPIQEMASMELSNSLLALGDQLEGLDTLINGLTRLRGVMQNYYNNVRVGLPGHTAPDI